jgi:hypothetical protein
MQAGNVMKLVGTFSILATAPKDKPFATYLHVGGGFVRQQPRNVMVGDGQVAARGGAQQ